MLNQKIQVFNVSLNIYGVNSISLFHFKLPVSLKIDEIVQKSFRVRIAVIDTAELLASYVFQSLRNHPEVPVPVTVTVLQSYSLTILQSYSITPKQTEIYGA